jgi:hypothetical protein
MNATAIYSKSGKGVQEASGKTSHLSRSDRAVLAAIDGRATLADVAQKVGKPFDPAFEKLIESLDKGGFIREVSAGSASVAAPKLGAKPAAKPAAASPMDASADLDFTTALSQPKAKAPPPPPPPMSAEEKTKAERIAREQQDAVARAREEAERKAAADRERLKAEAEAKMRAEQESKLRAEADAKIKAEAEAKAKAAAEAKVKAAQEAAARAAAEAKAKAEAEAKRVREEAERARKEAERARKEAEEKAERARKEAEEKAERARKEAEEKAERVRREAEEKARREQEELLRKLEEERRAREEAERKAQEEAKKVEEERRKLEEERVSRRIQEERERIERKRFQQEEEERAERAAARRRPKHAEDEPSLPEIDLSEPTAPPPTAPPPAAPAPAGGGGFSDTLLADLESFTTGEEEEQKAKEEAERKEKEAAAARAREAEERRAKEEAERREREERERRKREAAERKAREEAELREREDLERQRLREEEERRRREAEERAQKAKQEERLAAHAERGPGVFVEEAQARSRREREFAAKPRGAAQTAARKRWGKPIALTLLGLLVVAVGVAHVMPIDTVDYERAATDALGRQVRIGSARLSFLTGLQLKLSDVRIGDSVHIPEMRAYPELSALLGSRKTFDSIEIDGAKLDQAAVGQVLFAGIKAGNFSVGRVTAKGLELTGPLALAKGLELEAAYDRDGALRTATVRGPDALLAKFSRRGQGFDSEISAASFALPFAPEITISKFSAKGVATPQGMTVSEWDGAMLNGSVSGTANVRWGDTWSVDGVVTARNLYAAVFAPALVSDGKAEGSGKFQMRGAPGKLASTARLDGSFTVTRGVLGSIDLSRAIQTGGKFATGRTEFSEMNGQATYDRGAVALRNVTLGAGQLNAGASADIAQDGALSGRIVADVRVASQTLRATLNLAGTVKEPQVRN